MNPWDEPEWLEAACDWIATELDGAGITPTGPVEMVKNRPWSCVLALPTSQGRVFMKAAAPVTRHEPVLLAAFAEIGAPAVLRPIAVDPARGWMLLPDGGSELRQESSKAREFDLWERTLRDYARLQVAAAPRADALVAGGVPDFRLARFDQLIAELAPDRSELIQRRVAPLRAQLEAARVPDSVQHDDLHGGNILISDAGPIVFDWGDSCISHPFMTLTVTFRVIAWSHELAADDPVFDRLRAAYLEPWSGYGDPQQLAGELAAAVELGRLTRAFTYHRLAAGLPKPLHPIVDGGAEGWADVFLGVE